MKKNRAFQKKDKKRHQQRDESPDYYEYEEPPQYPGPSFHRPRGFPRGGRGNIYRGERGQPIPRRPIGYGQSYAYRGGPHYHRGGGYRDYEGEMLEQMIDDFDSGFRQKNFKHKDKQRHGPRHQGGRQYGRQQGRYHKFTEPKFEKQVSQKEMEQLEAQGKIFMTEGIKLTVKGQDALKRALNGDRVAVELLPPSKWYYPKKAEAVEDAIEEELKEEIKDEEEEVPQEEELEEEGQMENNQDEVQEGEGNEIEAEAEEVKEEELKNDQKGEQHEGKDQDESEHSEEDQIEQENAAEKEEEEKVVEPSSQELKEADAMEAVKVKMPVVYQLKGSEYLRNYNSLAKMYGDEIQKKGKKEQKKGKMEEIDLDFHLINSKEKMLEFIKQHQGVPRTRVIRIIKRNENPVLCTLHENRRFIQARPISESQWFNIQDADIPQSYYTDEKEGKDPSARYYMVKFKEWRKNDKSPSGVIVQEIGMAGNLEQETVRLLKQYECYDQVYSEEMEAKYQEDWSIPAQERKTRLDLSDTCIFTIDPKTARDLDDALSVTEISPGIYELGVHIADVSHFVQPNSDIDKEAIKRATSVYFVHRVIPMLPRRLCDNLCSLLPDRERLTFSCFFRVNAEGQMLQQPAPRFVKSIINSCAKWDYDLVQEILDGKLSTAQDLEAMYPEKVPRKPYTFDQLRDKCILMNKIAVARRAHRFDNGAVNIEQPQFSFTLDQQNLPLSFTEVHHSESHCLVEEFMLWANQCAAKRMLDTFRPKALLRRHPALTDESINKIKLTFQTYDLPVDMSSNITFHKSMEVLHKENPEKYQVAMNAFFSVIKEAEYFAVAGTAPDHWRHFGLNFDHYTHFTSPIRRYADLVVHRILTAGLSQPLGVVPEVEEVVKIAQICSEKSANARRASRECMMYFHSLMLKRRIEQFKEGPILEEAVLTQVTEKKASFFIKSINKSMNLKFDEASAGIQKWRYFPSLKVVVVLLKSNKPQEVKKSDQEVKEEQQQAKKVKYVKKGDNQPKQPEAPMSDLDFMSEPVASGKEAETNHLNFLMENVSPQRLLVVEVLRSYTLELFITKEVPLTFGIKLSK